MGNRCGWTVWGALFLSLGLGVTAFAGEPEKDLQQADRLACAFLKGITAGFTPQGGVNMKPPLDPNTPGLTIDIADRAKGRAVLEEDDKETAGAFLFSPLGLSVMARDGSGAVTLVTVYAQYSGISDNFLMVSSRHGGGPEPQISQRYGLCRSVPARKATSQPAPAPGGAEHK